MSIFDSGVYYELFDPDTTITMCVCESKYSNEAFGSFPSAYGRPISKHEYDSMKDAYGFYGNKNN